MLPERWEGGEREKIEWESLERKRQRKSDSRKGPSGKEETRDKKSQRKKRERATVAKFFYPLLEHVTVAQLWDIQTDQSENDNFPHCTKGDPCWTHISVAGLDHYQHLCVLRNSQWPLG